ncbi:MAG: Ig-like domain-containing protein [Chloroflexi bacterium]|nr:Ig-like domain-containing protein [Chloroflexota bacterium]
MKRYLPLLLILLLAVGCRRAQPTPEATNTAAPPPATATAVPVPTNTAIPPTPTPAPLVLDLTESDPLAPRVIGRSPEAGQEVGLDGRVELYFDQPMDREATAEALTIVSADGRIIEGEISWPQPRILRFEPTEPLAPDTSFEVALAETAASESGRNLLEGLTLDFDTTGSLQVVQVSPAAGTEEVNPETAVTVIFNRPVVPLVMSEQMAEFPSPLQFTPEIEGTGEWVNTSVYVFRPDAKFIGRETYSAHVSAEIVNELSATGSTLANDYRWNFSVAAPTIYGLELPNVTQWPSTDFEHLRLNQDFVVRFNQPMNTAATESAISFASENGQVPLRFTWSAENTHVIFTPTQSLALGTRYVLTVADTATAEAGGRVRDSLVWSATTALPPRITFTSPIDGERQGNYNSVFTIEFASRMDRESLLGKVLFEPAITGDPDGQYSSGEWSLRFFGLVPSTTYTVRILPGMADIYGNEITEEQVLTFTTAAYPARASLQMHTPLALYREGGSTAIWASYRNISEIEGRLFALTPGDLDSLMNLTRYYYEGDSVSLGMENAPFWRQSVAVEANQNSTGYKRFDLLNEDGSPLPPGVYYFELDSPQIPREFSNNPVDSRFILLANANVTLKTTATEVMAWVTDLETGAPLANVPITVRAMFEERPVASGRTDADGVFYADGLELAVGYDAVYIALAEGDGRFGMASSSWDEGTQPYDFGIYTDFYLQPNQPTTYIYTDRPIYRPGQTVSIKGIVRTNDDLTYSLPQFKQVYVRVGTYSNNIFEGEVLLNEMGTFVVDVVLDDEAELGGYFLDVRSSAEGEYLGYGNFSVAEYRKPTFQVAINPTQTDIALGQTVNATVQADFFAGGSVAGGDVYWGVRSTRFTFNPGGQYTPYSFTSPEPDRNGVYFDYSYDYYSQFIGEGTGLTDGRGQFPISVPSAPSADQPGSRVFEIEATVSDIAANAVSGRTQVIVHQSAFYPGIKPSQIIGEAGEEMGYDIVLLDWEANPVPNRTVQVEVVERRWNSVLEEDEFGNTIWTSEVEELPVANFDEVELDGNGRASVTFTPPKSGIYRAYVQATDGQGNTAVSTTYTWVSGGDYVPWRRTNDHGFDLITDATTYKPGDTAQILIASPFQGTAHALVTVERGHITQHEVIVLESNSTIYRLPITGDMAPNIFVSVMVMKGVDEFSEAPDFKLGMTQFTVEREEQELNITITPDRTTLGPRDTVNYTVRVTNHAGQPVQAELSAALVDLALLSISEPNSIPLIDFFYSTRWLSVRTALFLTKNMDSYNAELQEQIKGGGGGGGDGGIMSIREDFKDTAHWVGQLQTDANGVATFSVELPDNLTTWRLDVRAITADTLVGQATNDVQTTRPLLVSPQTPRFFVQGDAASVGTVVRNTTNQSMEVDVTMQATGAVVDELTAATQTVTVAANGSALVLWDITIPEIDRVDFVFSASSGEYSDAARPEIATLEGGGIPVYKYEVLETVGTAGQLLEGGTIVESIGVPILPNFTLTEGDVQVQIATSLAAAMTEALDYLEHYPYECTEQIVSKFLPNVLTTQALKTAGISNPALEQALETQVSVALQRLYTRQNSDGGWPWWSDYQSDTLVSAYVVQGMVEAKQAGYSVDDAALERGIGYLQNNLGTVDNLSGRFKLNRQAYLVYVLAQADSNFNIATYLDELYGQRENLDLYGRALLGQAMWTIDAADPRLATLTSDFVSSAALSASGTSWSENQRDYWNWNSDTRSTAIILSYMIAIDPENPLVANGIRWLMAHREAGYWQGTQETAWSIMALNDWMVATDELQADYQYEIAFNGQLLAQETASAETLRTPLTLEVGIDQLLTDELNRLAIGRTEGPGNLYYTAHFRASLPVPQVQPLDRGIAISRSYYDPNDRNTAVSSAVVGETLLARLTIVVPDDLHYVVIDDYLPAGLEAIDSSLRTTQQIGAPDPYTEEQGAFGSRGWGWWYFNHVQLRDERVVISSRYLPAGTYEYVYLVRATTAGQFNTIPPTAFGFYFPEVYGRGAGQLFTVTQE